MIFLSVLLLTVFWAIAVSQERTPLCDVCFCISPPNEPPSVDCFANTIMDIFKDEFWFNSQTSYSIHSLSLQYNNLMNMTRKFPASDLKELDLSDNPVIQLGPGIFSRLQNMTTLILSRNRIEVLNPHVFKGNYEQDGYYPLRALKELVLEYNNIHSLNSDVFEHADNIEVLNLSHNPLVVIDSPTVQAITSLVHLRMLNLAYTQIKRIPEYFLHTPKHLTYLDLSGNFMESMPTALWYSDSITVLSLSKNLIRNLSEIYSTNVPLRSLYLEEMPFLTIIGPNFFGQFLHLQEIYLSYNANLSLIHADAFVVKQTATVRKHIGIRKLFLDNNNLSALNSSMANWTGIEELRLSSNPWTCNCSNKWMITELLPIMTKMKQHDVSNLRCFGPRKMSESTFLQLYQNNTEIVCSKSEKKVRRVVVAFAITGVLLFIVLFFAFFHFVKRRKVSSGPKFHVIDEHN
ncbi:hypothetical protein FQA39_LY18601 [Lamprigera yunnana]|nr:hypothetical protein FQA39_LY18601 [Lamprigera yunnana]